MPYRTSGRPLLGPEPEPPPPDDRWLLWLALAVGLAGLVAELVEGGPFGDQASLSLLLAVSASVMLAEGGVRRLSRWRRSRCRRRPGDADRRRRPPGGGCP